VATCLEGVICQDMNRSAKYIEHFEVYVLGLWQREVDGGGGIEWIRIVLKQSELSRNGFWLVGDK